MPAPERLNQVDRVLAPFVVRFGMAKQKSQIEKFREAAREAETDESEDRFNETLKDLAKAPPKDKDQPDKPKR